MITVVSDGNYQLFETLKQTKLLILDKKQTFLWMYTGKIGEILAHPQQPHSTYFLLADNFYRLYVVKNEPNLTDLFHLELFVGNGKWQGYLLPAGLPTQYHKRNKIIPTNEIITQSLN